MYALSNATRAFNTHITAKQHSHSHSLCSSSTKSSSSSPSSLPWVFSASSLLSSSRSPSSNAPPLYCYLIVSYHLTLQFHLHATSSLKLVQNQMIASNSCNAGKQKELVALFLDHHACPKSHAFISN